MRLLWGGIPPLTTTDIEYIRLGVNFFLLSVSNSEKVEVLELYNKTYIFLNAL